MNKVLLIIAGDSATSLLQQSAEQSRITEILPEGKPGNESGKLAVCTETRYKQIQNQRKRTKKISAAAESNLIIAGEQAEFPYSTQAKEHEQCSRRSMLKEMQQAEPRAAMLLLQKISGGSSKAGRAGKSRQVDADLQESKFKNSDPMPTRPL